MRHFSILTLAAIAHVLTPTPSAAQRDPGALVLQRMHDAYAGNWYRTLTFVQHTIIIRPGGQADTTIWYESLSGPARLRIDIGSPSLGNGMLYTADSTINVRNGVVTRRSGSGNVFLPLIMGVYLQPVQETERQLKAFRFDLSRSYSGAQWRGKPAVVVGAAAASDTLSPQFWVDDRNLVVRVRGTLFGAQYSDIDLDGYEKLGDAWLATRVTIGGRQQQVEVYSDWKPNAPLAESLFDPAQWKTAPHWKQ